jgi:hypothetical protein
MGKKIGKSVSGTVVPQRDDDDAKNLQCIEDETQQHQAIEVKTSATIDGLCSAHVVGNPD